MVCHPQAWGLGVQCPDGHVVEARPGSFWGAAFPPPSTVAISWWSRVSVASVHSKMNKPLQIAKGKKEGREFYSSPSEDSCPGSTIFTKKRALLRKNIYYRGYMWFFVTSGVTNHHDEGHFRKITNFIFILCARLQASEVWEQNLGRLLLLSLVWNVSFRLFANRCTMCARDSRRALLWSLMKSFWSW